jgi:hypothetical protein
MIRWAKATMTRRVKATMIRRLRVAARRRRTPAPAPPPATLPTEEVRAEAAAWKRAPKRVRLVREALNRAVALVRAEPALGKPRAITSEVVRTHNRARAPVMCQTACVRTGIRPLPPAESRRLARTASGRPAQHRASSRPSPALKISSPVQPARRRTRAACTRRVLNASASPRSEPCGLVRLRRFRQKAAPRPPQIRGPAATRGRRPAVSTIAAHYPPNTSLRFVSPTCGRGCLATAVWARTRKTRARHGRAESSARSELTEILAPRVLT